MKSNKIIIPVLIIILSIFPITAFSATEAGKVEIVIHTAQNLEEAKLDWKRLMLYDPVMGGSFVRTLEDSKLKLALVDGSYLLLTENSKLKVDEVKKEGKSFLKMFAGKVRAVVKKVVGSDKDFKVQTPTAIVGVKGTDFAVLLKKDITEIIVFKGSVTVSNVLNSIAGEVTVKENYYTKVTRFAPPIEPIELSASERVSIVNKYGLSDDYITDEFEKIKKKRPDEDDLDEGGGDIEGTIEGDIESPADFTDDPGDFTDDFTDEIITEPDIEDTDTGQIQEPPAPPPY